LGIDARQGDQDQHGVVGLQPAYRRLQATAALRDSPGGN
jgi:hypothetical protein